MKRIEARKKEREKKTQDLQKLITAADGGPSPSDTLKRMENVNKKTNSPAGLKKRSTFTLSLYFLFAFIN